MAGGQIEARLVISGQDNTAAAFGSVIKHVDAISRALKGLNGTDKGFKPLDGLGRQVDHIDKAARSVDRLTNSMRKLDERMKTLHSIGGFFAGGAVGAQGVHAASDLGNAINQSRMAGYTAAELKQAQSKAQELSTQYPSVQQSQILDMIRSQRAVTGSFQEAMHVIDDNVRLRAVVQMKHPGEKVDEQFEFLNKGMELLGVTMDEKRHHTAMNQIAKAVNTFGSTLKLEDFFQFASKARDAGAKLDDEFMWSIMPTIASELRGESAGTALATASQAIVGGRMKHSAVKTMAQYGLIDENNVDRTKTGSIKGLRPGAVKGWDTFMVNPFNWVHQYLEPALAGIKDPLKKDAVIASMFSDRTAQQFIKILLNQAPRILKDKDLQAGAEGLESADKNKTRDIGTSIAGLTAATQNFLAAVSGPLAEAAIPILNGLSTALNKIAKLAQDNPAIASLLGIGTATAAAAVGAKAAGGVASALGVGAGEAGIAGGVAVKAGSNLVPGVAAVTTGLAVKSVIDATADAINAIAKAQRDAYVPSTEADVDSVQKEAADLRAKINDIRQKSKVPEMAETLISPLQNRLSEIENRLKNVIPDDESARERQRAKTIGQRLNEMDGSDQAEVRRGYGLGRRGPIEAEVKGPVTAELKGSATITSTDAISPTPMFFAHVTQMIEATGHLQKAAGNEVGSTGKSQPDTGDRR